MQWGGAGESGENVDTNVYRYRILKIPVSTSRGALYFGADESTENDYPRSAVFDPLRRTPSMINRISIY